MQVAPTGSAQASSYQAGALPRVQILSPTRPVTVPNDGQIPIRLQITGLKLSVANIGRRNVPGQGHYHFYVDCIPSDAYVRADLTGCWAGASGYPQGVFNLATSAVKVQGGTHVLLVALAQNDHVLYRSPPAGLVFTVIRPHPSIRLLSPIGPLTIKRNGEIPLALQVRGVQMNAAAMGRKSVPGQGHIHLYVDCLPPDAYTAPDLGRCWAGAVASTAPIFNLAKSAVKVTSGTHLLLIALAQNNHTLYRVPPAELIFTVR
jgi:hypothetical protein